MMFKLKSKTIQPPPKNISNKGDFYIVSMGQTLTLIAERSREPNSIPKNYTGDWSKHQKFNFLPS